VLATSAAAILVLAARLASRPRPAGRFWRSRMGRAVGALVVGALVVGACGAGNDGDDGGSAASTATSVEPPSTSTTSDLASGGPDLTALPLGDDRYSDVPRVGYVYACQTSFAGGGAFTQGPWIDAAAGTWNLDEKVSVEGDVSWPQAVWDDTSDGETRSLASVDLPVGHTTGVFPVAADTEAYEYDRNPNTIEAHDTALRVPARPERLDEPQCVGGEVGIMTTGVLIFSAFDAGGRDAVATEVQDHCQGHPQVGGYYHYHGPSECVEAIEPRAPDGEHSDLQAYAYDGFGIFGVYGEDGVLLSTDDLDECHGHEHEIVWDGETVSMYHYHFTPDFPYTVSCFRAEPQAQALSEGEERVAPGTGGPTG
jgi:hypothetical protein